MFSSLQPYFNELAIGLVSLVLGWLGKSKVQKKVEDADLTAKIQAVYRDMVVDADKRMDLLREEIKILKTKQTLQNEEWLKKLDNIEKSWQGKYSRLQTKYNNLLKKFEENS
ncbi:hypothetical protein PG913_08225 [Tenacibaculum pacificus]|uniref:hypothetical protein n=1 Tax=Tenacibaculum TaxID=104267 RepID=UPI0022F3A5F9|nr:hypothetical protein [Tenacibaculum pacificus]WBX72889.1 hypothetical protein PG913_08225 [Tenacibaculum pacificus]